MTAVAVLVPLARPVSADSAQLCAIDTPGWNVITDASSSSAGQQFLCNYRVKRDPGESGTAVTIEYYCSPAEGRSRYASVAGSRTTETFRDDTSGTLIIEEGPQARNPDNPQRDGVFSRFFTDAGGNPLPYGLMEKEWRLLNDQVFATIVTITNERGRVSEADRFGVVEGEAVARTLADRSRSAAGCAIPAVAGASDPTGTRAGPPVNVIIATGGITIVVIGGYTVWRRRKRAPRPAAATSSGPVPPQCQGLAQLVDDQARTVATLGEAEADLRRQLERAERIHTNNLVKARMVVNIEIISAVGGSATDLALALRPAVLRRVGPGALGQHDTWSPPGSMSSAFTERIRQAQSAASAAWSRVHDLKNEIEMLLGTVEKEVRELPIVKNAQQMVEFHFNRLHEMIADLPKANQLRTELTQLEHADEVLRIQRTGLGDIVTAAEHQLSSLETELNQARNAIAPEARLLQKDLDAAEAALARLHADGVEDTLRLAPAQDAVDALKAKLSSASGPGAADAAARISRIESELAERSAHLESLKRQQASVSSEYERLVAQRQKVSNQLLTGLNDLTSADIDLQGRVAAQAERELDTAVSEGRASVGQRLAERQSEVRRAEVDAASAQGLLEDLRAQAEQATLRHAAQPPADGGVVSAIGKAVWWASAPIRYPLTIAGELVFGVGQSPQEIVEILLQGRQNVHLLRSHLGAVRRGRFDEERRLHSLRRQLDDCVKGRAPVAVDTPAEQVVQAA